MYEQLGNLLAWHVFACKAISTQKIIDSLPNDEIDTRSDGRGQGYGDPDPVDNRVPPDILNIVVKGSST